MPFIVVAEDKCWGWRTLLSERVLREKHVVGRIKQREKTFQPTNTDISRASRSDPSKPMRPG